MLDGSGGGGAFTILCGMFVGLNAGGLGSESGSGVVKFEIDGTPGCS
jgi:hypothetical protein